MHCLFIDLMASGHFALPAMVGVCLNIVKPLTTTTIVTFLLPPVCIVGACWLRYLFFVSCPIPFSGSVSCYYVLVFVAGLILLNCATPCSTAAFVMCRLALLFCQLHTCCWFVFFTHRYCFGCFWGRSFGVTSWPWDLPPWLLFCNG